jgi:Flp pilus assembly pilin Flp
MLASPYPAALVFKHGLYMTKLANIARSFVREEEGATMVEYALVVAVVALVAVVGFTRSAPRSTAPPPPPKRSCRNHQSSDTARRSSGGWVWVRESNAGATAVALGPTLGKVRRSHTMWGYRPRP